MAQRRGQLEPDESAAQHERVLDRTHVLEQVLIVLERAVVMDVRAGVASRTQHARLPAGRDQQPVVGDGLAAIVP